MTFDTHPEQSPTTQPADASVSSGERSDTCSALPRHTELPWEMHVGWDVTGYPCFYLHGLSGDQKRDEQLLKSYCAYLVKCANAYPTMVKALRLFQCAMRDHEKPDMLALINALHESDVALKEAGEL